MAKTDHTIVSDLLTALRVPFTADYTEQRFDAMPFKTLFGVSKLLQEYGVDSAALSISDKSELPRLAPPFIAQTRGGLVIVTRIGANGVEYLTQGVNETMPADEFRAAWTGAVLLPRVNDGAAEPDYRAHRRMECITAAKRRLLWILAAGLAVYLLASNGTWRYPSVLALVAVDCAGLWFTYMLVQKSLSIKNPMADKVCGVLQGGGCDSILKTDASSFFGIFSWSEVGFTYFGVSLLALLTAPAAIHWLALINLCCLPFTVWSIWYQKFRARHWCTLCVSVQLTLWVQFFCYLAGGWHRHLWPFTPGLFALGFTYLFVLLALNRILPHFTNRDD